MTMLRYNAGKPPVTLIPTSFVRALMGVFCPRFTLEVARVLDFGRNKYAAYNWRKGGPWMDVLASGFRHVLWYRSGETHDAESELHHLAHLGCNIAFLLEFVEQGTPTDDRFFVEKLWPVYRAEGGDWLDSAVIEFLHFQDGGGAENLRQGLILLAAYYELLFTEPEPSAGAVASYMAMQESLAA